MSKPPRTLSASRMPERPKMRFDKRGPLAMRADFWGLDFFVEPSAAEPFTVVDDVAVINVLGALTHRDECWWCGFESYDNVLTSVRAACASQCKAIALVIDSPGGDVAGCFEAARAIRAECAEAGKELYAYVDGMACSGGYALACAASTIAVPETGFVGSIGVIEQLLDMTAQDAMFGERFVLVTSGARKADGNPHTPIGDSTLQAVQRDVDTLAEIFFEWVSESRGMSVEQVRALEAGIAHGKGAVAKGLADAVLDKKSLLALAAGKAGPSAANKGGPMGWKEDMYKAAEGGDEDAKSAIAHLAEQEDDPEDDKATKAANEGGDPDKDQNPPKGKKGKDDKEEPEAHNVRQLSTLVRRTVSSEVNTALEVERRRNAAYERVDARPDLTPEQKKSLKSKPTTAIVEHLDLLGDPKKPSNPAAAASVDVTAGRGDGLGAGTDRAPRLAQTEHQRLAERMGFTTKKPELFRLGTKKFYPFVEKEEAQAILKRNGESVKRSPFARVLPETINTQAAIKGGA